MASGLRHTRAEDPAGGGSPLSVELPVHGRPVTVAGTAGRSMTLTGALVGSGARVTVVSPDPTAYLSDLADRGLITILHRDFTFADIDSAALIFACTGDTTKDAAIAEEALARGVFCVVDPPRPTDRPAWVG